MCYNVYDDNLKKYLECENWYFQNKMETIIPGGSFYDTFDFDEEETAEEISLEYKYRQSFYWEMYFGDYFYDIVMNRKISGLIGLFKLFVSQFVTEPMKIHNFWDHQPLSNEFYRNGGLNEDVLNRDFDIFLKMLNTSNWNWFTDYSSRFYYYGGNYNPSINTKLFLHTDDLFFMRPSRIEMSFPVRILPIIKTLVIPDVYYPIMWLFSPGKRKINSPRLFTVLERPYLKNFAQKKLVPKAAIDYKLFYTNLTPLVYKDSTKPFRIIPFMQQLDKSPGPYNYNKSSAFVNKTAFKTLGNLDDYHYNLTPAWSFSFADWPEPNFYEMEAPTVADDKDWTDFEPDIDNRGYSQNKYQNETSRKFPLLVYHFQHYFLMYLSGFFIAAYTSGTETEVKETLKAYKFRLRDELLRPLEMTHFCLYAEQEMLAVKPRKYSFKNKLRMIAFFMIILILIILYPLYFI